METKNVIAALVVAAVLVAIVTIGIALVRLELSMIYTLTLILVGALSVALVIAALALPIRANKSGEPHERERIIERHTIDGRRDPNIITLPHNRSDADALFPRLMHDMLAGVAVVILSEVDFSHLSDREILGGIMAFLAGLVLGLRF
jgi:hypothetical protein